MTAPINYRHNDVTNSDAIAMSHGRPRWWRAGSLLPIIRTTLQHLWRHLTLASSEMLRIRILLQALAIRYPYTVIQSQFQIFSFEFRNERVKIIIFPSCSLPPKSYSPSVDFSVGACASIQIQLILLFDVLHQKTAVSWPWNVQPVFGLYRNWKSI